MGRRLGVYKYYDMDAVIASALQALITKMSNTGGHMASNLGVVEITVALHTVFNSPIDKIIFDVSHQSYVHKILTGRKEAFLDKEHYDDVSGYTNPDESEHDFFNVGHTSTSISLACGMAKARDIKGESENYGSIVANHLLNKMKQDKDVVVVAASTPLCIGFNSTNRKLAGKQFIDVGIAEQNALTMTAAIAKRGAKPVFATNSTFYQRAYDQIEQEMCISKCPATMIVSHASVWGHTNDTHAGLYDIVLLANIPNLIYLAPTNCEEYLAMLDWSIDQNQFPVAIRIPWTKVYHTDKHVQTDYSNTKYQITADGEKVAILALGSFYQLGEEVAEILKGKDINATLINPRYITGLDKECLEYLKENHQLVVTLEDGILNGGFGAKIAQYYSLSPVKVMNKGFDMNNIPTRFKSSELLEANGLLPNQIAENIEFLLKG